MRRRPVVAVCGGAAISDPRAAQAAERLGALLCQHGWNLVTGGMGGVMEAVFRGAFQARERGSGDCILLGILPTEDALAANPYCDIVVPSGMGIGRNILVVRSADAVVLVDGGSGTLSEAAYAWQLGRPIVALVSTGGWAEALAGRRLDGRRTDEVVAAADAEAAVEILARLFDEES